MRCKEKGTRKTACCCAKLAGFGKWDLFLHLPVYPPQWGVRGEHLQVKLENRGNGLLDTLQTAIDDPMIVSWCFFMGPSASTRGRATMTTTTMMMMTMTRATGQFPQKLAKQRGAISSDNQKHPTLLHCRNFQSLNSQIRRGMTCHCPTWRAVQCRWTHLSRDCF